MDARARGAAFASEFIVPGRRETNPGLGMKSARPDRRTSLGPGLRLEAILSLALVHDHMFVIGVLILLAMAGALFLGLKAGGAVLSPRPLRWLTRGYLPLVAVTMGLMLYKGYHVLLAVRHGARDLDLVDASYFGGLTWLRHGVYGAAHIGMAVSLGVFVVALWRCLRRG